MVLGGLYCWFGGIDSVAVRFYNLDGNILGCDELLDGTGVFVVKDVEGWLVTLHFEFGVYTLKYRDHACVFS